MNELVGAPAEIRGIVTVDSLRCEAVARQIAGWKIPEDREDLPSLDLSPRLISNFFLFLVAICHQTSPPGKPPLMGSVQGKIRRGWDYLLHRFYWHSLRDVSLLSPERWANVTAKDIVLIFHDLEFGDRLTEPDSRSALVRDLGQKMLNAEWDDGDRIYELCEAKIAKGNPNLLDMLSQFRAYNDPVRKKALYFLSVMRNTGRWQYVDPGSLGSPVDYHEVRGHLRLGTVQVREPELYAKLREGRLVTPAEDIQIRKAVYEAINLISERSGVLNPSRLHYLFWNVFRSVCLRDAPQCYRLEGSSTLPEKYRHLNSRAPEACPFSRTCQSAGAMHPIREHVFETDYY